MASDFSDLLGIKYSLCVYVCVFVFHSFTDNLPKFLCLHSLFLILSVDTYNIYIYIYVNIYVYNILYYYI